MDLLTHLETFCEVADQRSFTRAAETLGVPQPVVSRRVGALERRLGGRLLVRDPRGVDLTDLGRAVLPHAHGLRARAEHLAEVARTFHDGVVVAVPSGADPRALVAARAAAHDAGATTSFVEAAPDARAVMLADGSAQAAVTACPPDEADLGAPLGVATLSPDGGRLHLDDLRRGRGEQDVRATRVHLGAEDDVPWIRDVLRRRAAGAGLAAGQVAVGGAVLAAVTDVIEHGDLLVATRAEADRHGLAWRPVAGLDLWRGYRVAGSDTSRGPDVEVVRAVVPALARALGLAPGARR